jgi:flavodoxin
MKITIVYESIFGNTHEVARAIIRVNPIKGLG